MGTQRRCATCFHWKVNRDDKDKDKTLPKKFGRCFASTVGFAYDVTPGLIHTKNCNVCDNHITGVEAFKLVQQKNKLKDE